jgi:hypothetical protein
MIDLRLSIPVLFFVIFITGLSSCRENGAKDIRDYYFPLRELEDGLVYEYQPVHLDSLTPAYWYYRSFIQEEGVFLTGTYYEYGLVPLQLVREELVRNGMLVQDVYLYEEAADSSGQQNRTAVEVLEGSAFPFEVTDSSGVFLYKIRWEPPQDSGAVITLVKNRRYLKDTVVQALGETHDAVVFEVRELLSYDKEGVFEQEYGGREIYAKGIGLVYYDKKIGGSMALSYALERRYPMNELEEQYEQRIRAAQ